jgi:hypothetical protein
MIGEEGVVLLLGLRMGSRPPDMGLSCEYIE